MTDAPAAQEPLWNENEFLRLLEPRPAGRARGRGSGSWIRPAMRVYAWALGVTPVLSWFGPRHLTPAVLRLSVFAASAGGLALAILAHDLLITAVFGAVLVGSVLEAHGAARSRVVVGPFTGLSSSESLSSERIAELLRVELARIGDLFQSVEDQRAVSSGIGPKRALDATLSVDSIASALQAAVSAEAKVSLGPLSIPWRVLIAIPDRLVRPPRISGSLLADESRLIVTAQQDSLDGLSWRVPPESANGSAPLHAREAADQSFPQLRSVSEILRELALRIFTDLALGRSVRWQASEEFVHGLDRVRACLRAPLDRKVNLRRAEKHFLKTLREDEDFPHAYYNLGVVYNELFTLAWASGRTTEARNHLRAAEISFERAIQRDPQRWENYFALAQTHYQNRRFGIVTELCARMCELKRPGVVNRAKTRELYASALLAAGDGTLVADANRHARRAVYWSTLAAIRARLLPNFFAVEDELAAACLQTFGLAESVYAQTRPALWKRVERIYRRGRWLVKQNAELRVELGLLALGGGELGLAREQLQAAVRSDPARPLYLAALAAAVSEAAVDAHPSMSRSAAAEQISELIRRAAESMARAYSPARDGVACDLFARAADALGDDYVSVVARELCEYRDEANRRLAGQVPPNPTERQRDGGSIVSAAFLQAVPLSSAVDALLDEYGRAVQRAQALLDALREEATPEQEHEENEALLQREALTEAERATSLNPLSVLAWMTLGDVHQQLADYANAKEAWKNAQTQDPDNPALYGRLGTSEWQLAFQGRTRPSEKQLLDAKEFLDKALLLYEAGTLEEQIRTRYRLGKLFVALNQCDEAIAQFRIVETASRDRPPLVGWVLLGRAYLEARDYGEAEYHFGRVIQYGAMVDEEKPRQLPDSRVDPCVRTNHKPHMTVGTKVDEFREWRLAIVRAWGYLGRALSYVQRDGDLDEAAVLLRSARKLGESRDLPTEAQTRLLAACDDCEGSIAYKHREYEDAAKKLERSIRRHPDSRAYLNLAWTYVRLAETPTADGPGFSEQAKRCVDHAVSLDPDHETTTEIAEIRAAIASMEASAAGAR